MLQNIHSFLHCFLHPISDRQIIKASNPVIILVISRCYCSDLLNLQNLPELSRTSPHHNKHHKSYYKSKCIKKPIYYYSETRIGQIRHMRLRTECSSINHHLFLKNIADSPNCSCHQGVPETNSQYLFYCHRFNDSRNRYNILNQLIFLWTWQLTIYFLDHLTSQTIKITGLFLNVQHFIVNSKRFI